MTESGLEIIPRCVRIRLQARRDRWKKAAKMYKNRSNHIAVAFRRWGSRKLAKLAAMEEELEEKTVTLETRNCPGKTKP